MSEYKNKLGPYQLMIVSKYFESINDFKDLELATKKAKDNMEKFHYNPIPLTRETINHFSHLETLHVYRKGDEEFRERKFYKRIIHYEISCEEFLLNKQPEDIYLDVELDRESAKDMKTIPLGVTRIGEEAFERRNDIISIDIPTSVSEIGFGAFYNCRFLTSITIPHSVSVIGDFTFSGCTSLKSINIPTSVSQISENAFFY